MLSLRWLSIQWERAVKKLFSTQFMYGERKSVCHAETLLIYLCQSNTHTHTYIHTDCSPKPTSHIFNLDQHALVWLKIAPRVHCGRPLCEAGWDIIKKEGRCNYPPKPCTPTPRPSVNHQLHHHWPTFFNYNTQKNDISTCRLKHKCRDFSVLFHYFHPHLQIL